MNKRTRTLIFLNIIAFFAMLTLNYLSNSLPLNGKNPGQLSDQWPNFFVPAGQTFAIWGVIYTLLIIWVVSQVIALFRDKSKEIIFPNINQIGYLFLLTCVFNMAWLFAWHWEQLILSLVFMISLFVSLFLLNEKIRSGRQKLNSQQKFSHATFLIYQGWISIALIANVTAILVNYQWSGWGIAPQMWATIMIVIGTGIASFMVFSRNQIFHGLVVIWALYGIYIKKNALNDAETVKMTAVICMFALAIAVSLRVKRWWSY
jgi:translocator protein